MSEIQKSTLDPDVKYASGTSSDEVGYNSIEEGTLKKVTRISSIITVVVSGLALFSDGYNAQIIGYMEPLFTDLYKQGMTDTIKTRLSNSCTLLIFVRWESSFNFLS
jgi:hypothetical protein